MASIEGVPSSDLQIPYSHMQSNICTHSGLQATSTINRENGNAIMQGTQQRKMLMASIFLLLETTSFVLDQIGENQLDFLLASFVLSVLGFLTAAYSVAVRRSNLCRSNLENDLNMIEIVFSIVQLIMACIYLFLAHLGVEFKSNIASVFPLALAITAVALAYKRNKSVPDPTPTLQFQLTSPVNPDGVTPERGVELGVLENPSRVEVAPHTDPNQSPIVVNGEETADGVTPERDVELGVLDNPSVVEVAPHTDPNQSPNVVNGEETADGVTPERDVELGALENPSGVEVTPHTDPNQSPIVVNGEETATSTRSENEEILEKSRESGTTDTSGDDDIRDAKAPTTPATSSKTTLFSKHITTTDLEKEPIVPHGAVEDRDLGDLQVKDAKGEIGNSI